MDSNFQVKITADLSDLQNRLKNVEASLKTLGAVAESSNKTISSSFNNTATAVQKVGVDMNRARLATFAFGQVIRDAGFFSQSFGLGMLAISNNIPILIDQLVLLSGVSAGFGAALSVVGSLLAAGATVFAYWAQGVERNGGTVSGAINKMANDSESSLGRLVEYLNTPPASEILGKAVEGIKQGMDAIKKIIDAGVKLAIALWERFGPTVMDMLDSFFSMAKNVMLISLNLLRLAAAIVQGDWTTALKSIGNIGKLVFNNLVELAQGYINFLSKRLGGFVSLFDPLKGAMIEVAGQQVVKLGDSFKFASEDLNGFNFDLIDLINNLFKSDSNLTKTGKALKDTKSPLDELSDSLKVINNDITLDNATKAEERAKAYKSAINDMIKNGVDPASASIKNLQDRMASEFLLAFSIKFVDENDVLNSIKKKQSEAQEEILRKGAVKPVDITGDYQRQFTDLQLMMFDMIPTIGEMTSNIVNQVANGFADIIASFADGLGQLISGDMSIGEFGQSLVQSIGRFLSQIGRQMVAFGAATIAYGIAMKAIKSGNPAAMLTGGAGLIAAGAALSVIGAAISGLVGGQKTESNSARPMTSFGSINSGAVNFPTNTSAMNNQFSPGSVIAETRVSGNDLSILIKRADNNRNEYF